MIKLRIEQNDYSFALFKMRVLIAHINKLLHQFNYGIKY